MKFITALLVIVLLSAPVAYGATEKSFEEIFHVKPKAAEKLYGKEVFQRLKKAAEDFNAVLAGKKPINAKADKNHPIPADGGTSYYVGHGYSDTGNHTHRSGVQ